MKRILTIAILVFIALNGCKKIDHDDGSVVDNKVIISELYKTGMYWHAQIEQLKSGQFINIKVDSTFEGLSGGVIRVMGGITGSINIDDDSGETTGGSLSLGLTEIISDYVVMHNGKRFNIDGAPNIFLTGNMALLPNSLAIDATSVMEIKGNIHVVSTDYNEVIAIDLNLTMNADATGGHVTGTYNGEAVNYTF